MNGKEKKITGLQFFFCLPAPGVHMYLCNYTDMHMCMWTGAYLFTYSFDYKVIKK